MTEPKKSGYRRRAEELASQYWIARKIECDPESSPLMVERAISQRRAVWKVMDHVPADPLPEWVKPELVTIADRFAMKERSARYDLEGSPIVCKGHWPFDDSGYGIDKWLGDEWKDHESYRNGFRAFWSNDRLHAVITYCEGDFTLDILPDEASYRGFLGYADRFYKEHA